MWDVLLVLLLAILSVITAFIAAGLWPKVRGKKGSRGRRGASGPTGLDGMEPSGGTHGSSTGPTGGTGPTGAAGPTGDVENLLSFLPPLVDTSNVVEINGFVDDSKLGFQNSATPSKQTVFDLSGQTGSSKLTIAPQNISNMTLHIPQVATLGGAGMALTQDETTQFIFSNGITSSIGGANSMMQLANATVANRAQIKLHSYFNGNSVAGVSTLTSRSGTIAVNSAVVAGQDYSKWTAQAAATTPGSAPISGSFAFKASVVNSLTVPSDFHIQLTNTGGVLADRLYLTSEGALTLPHYTTPGYAKFDASGNITSSPILAFSSNASVGGAASEALTVTGLLASDTILAVSQQTAGANNTAITSFSGLVNNGLTVGWTADPGAGAVVLVTIQR